MLKCRAWTNICLFDRPAFQAFVADFEVRPVEVLPRTEVLRVEVADEVVDLAGPPSGADRLQFSRHVRSASDVARPGFDAAVDAHPAVLRLANDDDIVLTSTRRVELLPFAELAAVNAVCNVQHASYQVNHIRPLSVYGREL